MRRRKERGNRAAVKHTEKCRPLTADRIENGNGVVCPLLPGRKCVEWH